MEGENGRGGGGGSGGDDGPTASSNGGPTSHQAAAVELMKLLDDELHQAHSKIDAARRQADDARQNAAAAAEVARRYRTRNYRPVDGLDGVDGTIGDGGGEDEEGVPVQEQPLSREDLAQMQTTGPNDNDVAMASSPTVKLDENVADTDADADINDAISDDNDQEDIVVAADSYSSCGGQSFAEEHDETAAIHLNDTQDDEHFHDASEHHEVTSDGNQESIPLKDAGADDDADGNSAYMEDDYEGSVDAADAGAGTGTPAFDKSMPPLPAGWVETMDEASGVPYYYREVDGYTTWERPVAEDTVADELAYHQQYVDGEMLRQQPQPYVEEPQSRPDDAPKPTIMNEPQQEEGWDTPTPGKWYEQVQGTPSSAGANILTPTSGTAVHDNIRSPLSVQSARSGNSRLARSNAEDVLSISMQLETVREQVDKERSGHEQARTELAEAREANQKSEEEIQKLKDEREGLVMSHSTEVEGLRIELNWARHRVTAAEEDANLALDIAKGSAESREQLEGWLQRALDEIEILREQLANATAVGPGGGQVILIGSPTSTPNQKHTPRPPPPRSSQGRESSDDDGTFADTGVVDLGIGSPLTSIAEESIRENSGGNMHATSPKQRPPLPPLPGNPSGTDAAASNGDGAKAAVATAAAAVMQRSKSATTTTVTTTVTTTESTTEYMSGGVRCVPPPPVQTPSNTPQRESTAPPAMVAAGRAVLGRSMAPGSAQAKQQARSERLAALVHSSRDKQHRLEEKLKINDKVLANSTLAMAENRLAISGGRGDLSRSLVDPSLLRRVALILSESGTKLALGGPRRRDGRWGLRVEAGSDGKEVGLDDCDGIDFEALVTDYCTSVEAKVGKVEEEIEEVRAFCEYLEKKVITEPLDS
jgi:hypothetical protein